MYMPLSQINKPYTPMQEQQMLSRDIAEHILPNRRQVIGLGRRIPCDVLQEDLVTLGFNLQRPEQARQLENSSKALSCCQCSWSLSLEPTRALWTLLASPCISRSPGRAVPHSLTSHRGATPRITAFWPEMLPKIWPVSASWWCWRPKPSKPGPRVRPQDGPDNWLPINGEAVHSSLLQDEQDQAHVHSKIHLFMASQDASV